MTPSPPLQYQSHVSAFNLNELSQVIVGAEEQRQKSYDLSRKIHAAVVQARREIQTSPHNQEAFAHIDAYVDLIVRQQTSDRAPRLANLSLRMEEVVRLKAFQHFLVTGKLISPSPMHFTDEEYLAGACMGLAQDLQRYGLGRATARDVPSVKAACELVQAILNYLLGFDFRNGPLRRKYDGTKYALKGLETLLYELSVTGETYGEPDSKRRRQDDDVLLPMEELQALRKRMEHRDELRESLIKKSRDGQKAAKQAIFALHRGDRERAFSLLEETRVCITSQLLPIIDEESPLRSGSFSNVLEEYVEAKLFAAWLYPVVGAFQSEIESNSRRILQIADFDVHLEPEEYLGGLCDLTGEIGRYAVQCGTLRDDEGVERCMQTNLDVYTSIESMEHIPGRVGKKMDQLRISVEKLERMLYEMSLSEAVGRNVHSQVQTVPTEKAENDSDL
jgi:predicted translin family RNA/ssDNA-binding protein